MSQAYEPVKWVDGLGKVSWQPRTLSGKNLYWSGYYGADVWFNFAPTRMRAVRYRSKARANRVARRKDKQDARGEWREA